VNRHVLVWLLLALACLLAWAALGLLTIYLSGK
jgi:hypothetical protein